MNKTQSWKERISEKLPMLVLAFCLLQPLLDVAGFWQDQLHIGNTVTMALRMLLLAGSVLLGFLLSDRKRYYYIAAAVLLVLTGGHILACMQNAKGYREPVNDLINLVRIYFLPMMTLCFITFLRRNEKVFPAMQKGMLASLLEIALVQLLSTVTGTDPHTYAVDGIGILGWFMWTNSQSAILAMVAPISICWAIRLLNEKPLSGGAKWRYLQIALITAVAEATLFVLAPRLSYFSLLFCGFGVCTCLLITDRKQWKMALAIFLVTALFTAAYPFSPTYRRMTKNVCPPSLRKPLKPKRPPMRPVRSNPRTPEPRRSRDSAGSVWKRFTGARPSSGPWSSGLDSTGSTRSMTGPPTPPSSAIPAP